MLNYEFPPIGGGTGVACQHLLRELARDPDVSVDLVTSGVGASRVTESLGSRITLHRLPVAKRDRQYWRSAEIARWTLRAIVFARRLARTQRYDLCHAWGGWPSGIPAFLLRRRLPYVVALRGSDVPGYNQRLALLDAVLLRHVSRRIWKAGRAVVSVSDALCDLARTTAPELARDVIPNGVDAERFCSGDGRDPRTVLFVGRLVERKGIEDLVCAFSDVVRTHASARLVIVGEGPERPHLEKLAGRGAAAKRIRFLGRVDHAKLPEIYRSAGIFVLPSRREGMPNVLLEAMASGLPVVCTTAAAAGLIRDNGIVVDPHRPAAIREALERYLADPALQVRHGARSRAIALGMSWSSVATWYREVYERVTRKSRAPRERRDAPPELPGS